MFKLEIETGNAAFGETHGERCEEVARILRRLADYLAGPGALGHFRNGAKLMDANGNTVGSWTLTDD